MLFTPVNFLLGIYFGFSSIQRAHVTAGHHSHERWNRRLSPLFLPSSEVLHDTHGHFATYQTLHSSALKVARPFPKLTRALRGCSHLNLPFLLWAMIAVAKQRETASPGTKPWLEARKANKYLH